jgi:hypothetical protein
MKAAGQAGTPEKPQARGVANVQTRRRSFRFKGRSWAAK